VRPVAFLDRDGTLIEESGYLDRLERLAFFPFSVDAVRILNQAGLAVVVVTNQSGVARGLVREAFIDEAHTYIAEHLAVGGAHIDGFYYCPHHPAATLEAYRVRCDCRKPQPGLLRRAALELELDLSRSFSVGDRWQDLQAGRAVGGQSVLVRTGYGRVTESQPVDGFDPDAVADNLIEAVSWILRRL
jgi:D-glycero-D-manno-heptose 1,7-bisphosphate phosphatase